LRRASVALALVAVVLGADPATAALADRIGATFGLMVSDIIQAFQPITGLVVAAAGEAIYVDLGSEAGAKVGQELTVFRRGAQFRHPITGKTLGHYEQVLGYAQIRRVEQGFSEAAFIPAPEQPAPRSEDGARITSGRIKVAITPVLDLTGTQADVRRVPYMLANALERSKRFQVVDPLAVGDMFANTSLRVEEVLARPERAVRAAKNLEVSAWMIPILIERRGVTYLDVTIISSVTGNPLLSRRQPLVPAGEIEEQRFPWEPRAED
jgi:hypothetical protein